MVIEGYQLDDKLTAAVSIDTLLGACIDVSMLKQLPDC